MAATFESSLTSKVVRISPIPDEIMRLQVISCDACSGKASFDVYTEGAISDVNILKRYCDECVKRLSQ